MLVLDGAMGTMLSGDSVADALNLSAPELVRSIHRQYLSAGADIVKTNTFNSNCGPHVYEWSLAGARLAREVADEFIEANPSHHRLVAGVLGPGRGLPSDLDFLEQVRGLRDGGADILLSETLTSIAVAREIAATARNFPLMLSVTISKSGTLLSGETLAEFWHAVSEFNPLSVGINCSLGARHVGPFVEALVDIVKAPISCHPSTGLPNASGGYDESPAEFAAILCGFASKGWLAYAGGCCGTTPAHIGALVDAMR